MNASPSRSPLYRKARWFVICGALFAAWASAQTGKSAAVRKGPRALGLLELAPDGTARLIPITILVDGQYFDAGAYKAVPVPMALWSDTVYEGIQTGVSQGLFTVSGALQRNDTHEWLGQGRWQSASALEAAAKEPKKTESSEPRGMNGDEGPPVLRRAGSQKPKPPETAATTPVAEKPAATGGTATPAGGNPPVTSAPEKSASASPSSSTSPATAPTAKSPPTYPTGRAPDNAPEDKDAPVLKRGMPTAASKPAPDDFTVASPKGKTGAQPSAQTKLATMAPTSPVPAAPPVATPLQLIPAISDSAGPDLRPYAYGMKPDEENSFRNKMLALAADEVRTRGAQMAGGTSSPGPAPSPQSKARATKLVQPTFDNAQLRVFDLSNMNEPELVLTARARMPQPPAGKNSGSSDLQFMVTLVAREDINGVLHKQLANVTDTQHLDVLPRLDLIDAIDVDGDGRGELLFQQVSDAGRAFVVYRVIGDRLFPLFQGVPGS